MTTTNETIISRQHVTRTVTPLSQIKWALLRGTLSTVGRASRGIQIGYRAGFDSGTMLDYVYVNKAHGVAGIGTLIDRVYLNAIGWRAIRARRVLLKQQLHAEIERNRASSRQTRILDVAAGPGRYLQELIQECGQERDDLRVLCRDLSPTGLAEGAQQAEAKGLRHLHYEQGDAFHPAPTEVQLGGRPNIIVVSGLYELLLDDETIQQSLTQLYQLLEVGGAIFFTTQTHHPQLEFIANVLPNRNGDYWVMKCRPVALLENWACRAGFTDVQSQYEEVGLFTVTSGRKHETGL